MPGLPAKAREFLKTHILRKPKRRMVARTPLDGGLPPNGVRGSVVRTPLGAAEHGMRPTASDATSGTEVDYRKLTPVLGARPEDAPIVNQPIQNNANPADLRSHAQPERSNAEAVDIQRALPGIGSTTANAAPRTAVPIATGDREVAYFNRPNAPTVNPAIQNNAYSSELRSHVQPAVSNADVVTTAPTAAVASPSPGDNYHNLEENPIHTDTVDPAAPLHSWHSGRANVPDLSDTPSIYDDFVALRHRVDRRLAHLRTFWSVGEWDEIYASAVKGVTKSDDVLIRQAIQTLTELDRKLSDADEAHKAEEANVRLSSLEAALFPAPPLTPMNPKTPLPNEKGSDVWMLDEEAAKSFRDRYDAIRNEVRPNAAPPLEAIRKLQKDYDEALARRRHFLSSQMERMDVLKPLFDRAMSIANYDRDQGAKDELASAWANIASKEVTAEERDQRLEQLTALATKIIKTRSKDRMLGDQKVRLPVHPSQLREGGPLGSGNFGEVITLLGSDYPPLVGKRSKEVSEIKHEEAVYAQLGEHPNIAKCYGIHAVGGKDMLVMENVGGGDIAEVLEGLRKRFRDVAREREVVDPNDPERKRRIVNPVRKDPISRAEYLGSVQQILKGILQGLAHFESLGLVHRDVKGDNIRLDPQTLQPKLVDMGLAQQVGPRDDKPHAIRITPPENLLPKDRKEDPNPTVTPVWDAFSVSKVLFPLLEQESPHEAKPEPAEIYQFLTGNPEPGKAHLFKGIYVNDNTSNIDVVRLAASAMERDPATGQVRAKRTLDGKPAWQALSPASAPGTAAPGLYGVMTAYVDFMNGLTHSDPAQRLSPIEALKHPFMTERLIEESQLAKMLKPPRAFLRQEAEPAPTAYADPLPPNPTLYFQLNSQSGFNYRVDSRDPGSPWARVEQFCAYLAAEWINNGCPAQGLRFDGLASRQDAVDTVRQWAGRGGLAAQASYAARRIAGRNTPSATVLDDVRLKCYGPGTVLWFGTDAHTWAATVQPDGNYLVYDPNTGKTTVSTPAEFATNQHGANVFVVRSVASAGIRESAPDSPPSAPASSPRQHRAKTAIEFALSTVRTAYDRDASLLGGTSSAQLQETGKARGSSLQGAIDTMSRVQNLHAELRTAPTKYAVFNAALQELRSQAEHYLLEHPRPVSSDGKARKKACEAIGKCVATIEASLKTARDQVESITDLVRELPSDQRGSDLLEAYNNLMAQPYTPADIREDRTKFL
ncbi:MAG: protein kinase [Sterolibacteriaceae bacterium]|nr:protein kinase [Candidatus Methylophosphatis haderslevensis]